jgi:hypothetical protein
MKPKKTQFGGPITRSLTITREDVGLPTCHYRETLSTCGKAAECPKSKHFVMVPLLLGAAAATGHSLVVLLFQRISIEAILTKSWGQPTNATAAIRKAISSDPGACLLRDRIHRVRLDVQRDSMIEPFLLLRWRNGGTPSRFSLVSTLCMITREKSTLPQPTTAPWAMAQFPSPNGSFLQAQRRCWSPRFRCVAPFLGWSLAAESLSLRMTLASGIILTAVKSPHKDAIEAEEAIPTPGEA